MTKQELIKELKEQGIQANTISFYIVPPDYASDYDEGSDESEAFFGTCDLSNERGDCVHCRALDADGNVIHFDAGSWLVHGHLGKLAGAF